jgi:hypothetical protein
MRSRAYTARRAPLLGAVRWLRLLGFQLALALLLLEAGLRLAKSRSATLRALLYLPGGRGSVRGPPLARGPHARDHPRLHSLPPMEGIRPQLALVPDQGIPRRAWGRRVPRGRARRFVRRRRRKLRPNVAGPARLAPSRPACRPAARPCGVRGSRRLRGTDRRPRTAHVQFARSTCFPPFATPHATSAFTTSATRIGTMRGTPWRPASWPTTSPASSRPRGAPPAAASARG